MTTKIHAEKSIMAGKLRLFDSIAKEAIIIAADDLVNYDSRSWQVVNDHITDRAIRLEEIEAKRQN